MRLLRVLVLILFAVPAAAQDYSIGDLQVEHPWARATIGNLRMTAGYMTVVNAGEVDDRLIAVEIPGAMMVELHVTEDGKMRGVEAFEIPAGGTLLVRPGGNHLMIGPLSGPLAEGETLAGLLVFERAGRLPVEFDVEAADATESQ